MVSRWLGGYEAAWRASGTDGLAGLFTSDATYLQSPYEQPIAGLDAIRWIWEEEREGPDEVFALATEILAVDGLTAVVRAEVCYGDPPQRWRRITRRAGIRLFVLAYFGRSAGEVQGVREALGLPLRVVRLTVHLPDIERRLAGDVTSGRRDDLREAASSIAAAEGAGVEDVTIGNDRPIGVVARDVMTFLRWL